MEKEKRRIGIVGSRRRNLSRDYLLIKKKLIELLDQYEVEIISGGCHDGADRFAERLAKEIGLTIKIHYPRKSELDENLLKSNSRAAYAIINFARNTLIAEDSDILIACVSTDRKGGTEDTIKKYKNLGKEYLILI